MRGEEPHPSRGNPVNMHGHRQNTADLEETTSNKNLLFSRVIVVPEATDIIDWIRLIEHVAEPTTSRHTSPS